MNPSAKEKIIIALDVPDSSAAFRLLDSLGENAHWVKVGLQLFTSEGPDLIRRIKERGLQIFLDLKFHDIPNTAREAVRSAARLDVGMTTIHLCGGSRMIAESVAAAGEMLVLGVSVLTSMDDEALRETGVAAAASEQVLHLARLGVAQGLRGVVASPHEITALREAFGADLAIVTPGVRPAGADAGDQKRIMTPREAIDRGASHLVIGRPITGVDSPKDALQKILAEIS